jgi:hypothetical protein
MCSPWHDVVLSKAVVLPPKDRILFVIKVVQRPQSALDPKQTEPRVPGQGRDAESVSRYTDQQINWRIRIGPT